MLKSICTICTNRIGSPCCRFAAGRVDFYEPNKKFRAYVLAKNPNDTDDLCIGYFETASDAWGAINKWQPKSFTCLPGSNSKRSDLPDVSINQIVNGYLLTEKRFIKTGMFTYGHTEIKGMCLSDLRKEVWAKERFWQEQSYLYA